MDRKAIIQRIADRLISRASLAYDVKLDVEPIKWYPKGLHAGWAQDLNGSLQIGLSEEALNQDELYVATMVLTHELAHLIDYVVNGNLKADHNPSWKDINFFLGGDGKRTHSLKLSPARKHVEHQYRTAQGHTVWVGPIIHDRLQNQFRTRVVKKTQERISAVHYTGKSRKKKY